jgi:two-component system OmpR family response regulator
MKTEDKKKLFLVDDDAVFLKLLEHEFLQLDEFIVETFSTGEQLLPHLSENPDAIILDYQLDGIEVNAMNGIKTLDEIKAFKASIPVIMLSSQDKIEVAVDCMHHKAFDYVIKSETSFIRIQKILTSVFQIQKMQKQLSWYMDRM